MKKITPQNIELAIVRQFNPRQNIFVPNVSWGLGLHECDLLMLSNSGYLTEFEIKINAADLKKDKLKDHHHNSNRIKCLYFVFPEQLLKYENEVPERAGILIYVQNELKDFCKTHRPAQKNKLAKPVSDEDKYQLVRLGSLRIWNLKSTIEDQKNYIESLCLELKKYKSEDELINIKVVENIQKNPELLK